MEEEAPPPPPDFVDGIDEAFAPPPPFEAVPMDIPQMDLDAINLPPSLNLSSSHGGERMSPREDRSQRSPRGGHQHGRRMTRKKTQEQLNLSGGVAKRSHSRSNMRKPSQSQRHLDVPGAESSTILLPLGGDAIVVSSDDPMPTRQKSSNRQRGVTRQRSDGDLSKRTKQRSRSNTGGGASAAHPRSTHRSRSNTAGVRIVVQRPASAPTSEAFPMEDEVNELESARLSGNEQLNGNGNGSHRYDASSRRRSSHSNRGVDANSGVSAAYPVHESPRHEAPHIRVLRSFSSAINLERPDGSVHRCCGPCHRKQEAHPKRCCACKVCACVCCLFCLILIILLGMALPLLAINFADFEITVDDLCSGATFPIMARADVTHMSPLGVSVSDTTLRLEGYGDQLILTTTVADAYLSGYSGEFSTEASVTIESVPLLARVLNEVLADVPITLYVRGDVHASVVGMPLTVPLDVPIWVNDSRRMMMEPLPPEQRSRLLYAQFGDESLSADAETLSVEIGFLLNTTARLLNVQLPSLYVAMSAGDGKQVIELKTRPFRFQQGAHTMVIDAVIRPENVSSLAKEIGHVVNGDASAEFRLHGREAPDDKACFIQSMLDHVDFSIVTEPMPDERVDESPAFDVERVTLGALEADGVSLHTEVFVRRSIVVRGVLPAIDMGIAYQSADNVIASMTTENAQFDLGDNAFDVRLHVPDTDAMARLVEDTVEAVPNLRVIMAVRDATKNTFNKLMADIRFELVMNSDTANVAAERTIAVTALHLTEHSESLGVLVTIDAPLSPAIVLDMPTMHLEVLSDGQHFLNAEVKADLNTPSMSVQFRLTPVDRELLAVAVERYTNRLLPLALTLRGDQSGANQAAQLGFVAPLLNATSAELLKLKAITGQEGNKEPEVQTLAGLAIGGQTQTGVVVRFDLKLGSNNIAVSVYDDFEMDVFARAIYVDPPSEKVAHITVINVISTADEELVHVDVHVEPSGENTSNRAILKLLGGSDVRYEFGVEDRDKFAGAASKYLNVFIDFDSVRVAREDPTQVLPPVDLYLGETTRDTAQFLVGLNAEMTADFVLEVGDINMDILYEGEEVVHMSIPNFRLRRGDNPFNISFVADATTPQRRLALERMGGTFAIPPEENGDLPLSIRGSIMQSGWAEEQRIVINYDGVLPSGSGGEAVNPVKCQGLGELTFPPYEKIIVGECYLDMLLEIWFSNPMPFDIRLSRIKVTVEFDDPNGFFVFPMPRYSISVGSVDNTFDSFVLRPNVPTKVPVLLLGANQMGDTQWNEACVRAAYLLITSELEVDLEQSQLTVFLDNFEYTLRFDMNNVFIDPDVIANGISGSAPTCEEELGLV